ncbi:MAG: helix-turn-helix transcriptional regulator [Saprospiraceae bacterium]|nr:helix-turn-helix transcriptional regulator [Saprospiraceae bacterium]
MDKNGVIAARIKQLRISKNILQKSVADHLGLSDNAYSRIENGYTHLTINNLYKIKEVLQVSIEDILELKQNNIFNNSKNIVFSQFNEGELQITLNIKDLNDLNESMKNI